MSQASVPLWRALWLAMRSWRTASVMLLSFSSGLPLGLVLIAIPTWLARHGVDVKTIGLFTLAQAPWTFKFLWSPLMDRYAPPIPWLGRKLGWTLLAQIGLLVTTLVLAGIPASMDWIWLIGSVTLAMALASASQDIAVDAYAVEVLRPEEQGVAVGARTAVYRAAMFVAGGLTITLAGWWSWSGMFFLLALCYLPMMLIAAKAPRPEAETAFAPPTTMRAAVWEPFKGFLSTHRALEILAFVILYKLADNLGSALVRPFLVQVGFNDVDVGVATASIGLFAGLAGTFIGGALTNVMGLGRALWVFGALQVLSNFGYVLIAEVGLNRPLMYGAMGVENFTSGMGTGAFSVLLLRLTQKRFSATQYALFSSLFALPRLFGGPITGVLVDAIGWRDFFVFTILAGIPGLLMLQRFAPIGVHDPQISVEPAHTDLPPATRDELVVRGLVGALVGLVIALASAVLLEAARVWHAKPAAGFDLLSAAGRTLMPTDVGGWLAIVGVVVFAAVCGLLAAAARAAKAGPTHAR